MSLEDAIKHCEEVAEGNEQMATYDLLCTEQQKNDCLECATEHRQLAEWLRELKIYREKLKNGDLRGCTNCKYTHIDIADYPCNVCNKTDLWRVKVDDIQNN